jgi:hypothetical protein
LTSATALASSGWPLASAASRRQAGAVGPLVAEGRQVPALHQPHDALAFGHVLVIGKRMAYEAEQQEAHGNAHRQAEHHHRGIRRFLEQ